MPTVRKRMNITEIALDRVKASVQGKRSAANCSSKFAKRSWGTPALGCPEEIPAGCIKMDEMSGRPGSHSGSAGWSGDASTPEGGEVAGMCHLWSLLEKNELG